MILKKIILLYFFTFLLIGKTNRIQAQTDNSRSKIEEPSLSKTELRKQIPKYITIGIGETRSDFRDFATSPLFYSGKARQISLSYLVLGDNQEAELGASYDYGTYFNLYLNSSSVKRIELNYSHLFRVGLFNPENTNLKLGFLLSGNRHQRMNEDLRNNANGSDIFANLLGSVKITKDLSSKVTKEKKFLFLKYKLKERKRNVAFRLNVGMVNSSYRNGYAYSNQSLVINAPKEYYGYEFNIFSGFRASSRVDYTHYLNNKNAVQLSYVWDAYSTGGDLDKFQMAHHVLKLTLLFNTNNQ